MKYKDYIPIALNIANIYCNSEKHRFRHVSLILSGKSIVGVGTNSYTKTHPFNKFNKYRGEYIHSELDAYIKVRHQNTNLILLNFRFTGNHNQLALAKPCKYCLPWCIELFDKIYYSTNEGQIIKL